MNNKFFQINNIGFKINYKIFIEECYFEKL